MASVTSYTQAGTNALLAASPSVETIAYASTITPNATAAMVHRVTLTGNMTVASPTNPSEEAWLILEMTASGGPWTVTWTTGSNTSFKFNTTTPGINPIAAGTKTKIGFQYSTVSQRWEVMFANEGN